MHQDQWQSHIGFVPGMAASRSNSLASLRIGPFLINAARNPYALCQLHCTIIRPEVLEEIVISP